MTSMKVVPALALLLAACSGQGNGMPDSGPAAVAGAPVAPAPAAPPAPPSPQQDETSMHIDCQGTRLSVEPLPDAGEDASLQTRLEIDKDGQRRAIDKPAEMTDYTAVGLACVQDKAGTPYFVVQYGELPFGCQFCEWFYLYDAEGKQLTHSNPPLRGHDDTQEPNNDEYQQWLEKLGVPHPEVTYFKSRD